MHITPCNPTHQHQHPPHCPITPPPLPLPQVHIIPESVMELSELMDYPIGGVTVLFGILALVVVDSSLTSLWAPRVRDERTLGRVGFA